MGLLKPHFTGKVTDFDTAEELIAANVTLYKDGVLIIGVATDFDGNYTVNTDPGTYDVDVSYIGYQTYRIENVFIKANLINRLDISLGGGVNPAPARRSWMHLKTEIVPFNVPDIGSEDVVIELLDNLPMGCQ